MSSFSLGVNLVTTFEPAVVKRAILEKPLTLISKTDGLTVNVALGSAAYYALEEVKMQIKTKVTLLEAYIPLLCNCESPSLFYISLLICLCNFLTFFRSLVTKMADNKSKYSLKIINYNAE